MATAEPNARTSPKKDWIFWGKIICTQYLIRHPFWKSFAIPMIIGQISVETKIDYTDSKYLSVVYLLIGLHFLSGIVISDRKFRHALGFVPHILALAYTAYLFYSNILTQLIPWIKIRIITHALGTLGVYCFIASLHTKSISFRSILRRLGTYFNVFYFVLNAYVLWWSNDETKLVETHLWTLLLRLHAILCFFVSGGFSLDLFTVLSTKMALYLIGWNILFDGMIFYQRTQSETNLWIVIDYLMDDLAMLAGYFYLYQFHLFQKTAPRTKTD